MQGWHFNNRPRVYHAHPCLQFFFFLSLLMFYIFMAHSLLNRHPEASCKQLTELWSPLMRKRSIIQIVIQILKPEHDEVVMCLTVHSKKAAE